MTDTTRRLEGYEAIEYVESLGGDERLRKYGDPTEGWRSDLTPDEAREIAATDPSLIYYDPGARPMTTKLTDVQVQNIALMHYESDLAAADGPLTVEGGSGCIHTPLRLLLLVFFGWYGVYGVRFR